jgi:DNA-binding NtrC family response regulator
MSFQKHILVVDDDVALANAVADALRDMSHSAIDAQLAKPFKLGTLRPSVAALIGAPRS